jgi:hypothetical protein
LFVIAQEFARVVCFSLILKSEFIDRILETDKESLASDRASLAVTSSQLDRFNQQNSQAKSWQENLHTTFNQDRFEDCPPEVIFGEVVLMEINDFISILYAALVRFYLPAVPIDDLELMTQDLIEIVTSVTIDGSLSNWLIKLCRLTLSEEEQLLRE